MTDPKLSSSRGPRPRIKRWIGAAIGIGFLVGAVIVSILRAG